VAEYSALLNEIEKTRNVSYKFLFAGSVVTIIVPNEF